MKQINVAIVGYGMSGRIFHLPPLLKNNAYHVVAIMTNNQTTIDELKQKYPTIAIVSTLSEIEQDSEIDLVVLATPNEVHFDYTKRLLLARKHVVVEKPFTETANQANELFTLSKTVKRVLRVFHNRQYDGDFLTVQEVIAREQVGRILEFHSRFDRYRPELKNNAWREKPGVMAGVFYDLAPHLVHHAVMLFGLPQAVFGDIRAVRDHAIVDDRFEITLFYPQMRAYLGADIFARNPAPKLKIVGTDATYESWGFNHPDILHEPASEKYNQITDRSRLLHSDRGDDFEIVDQRYGEHYRFYSELAADIHSPKEVDEQQELAYQVVFLMEQIWRSHCEGAVITVSKSVNISSISTYYRD